MLGYYRIVCMVPLGDLPYHSLKVRKVAYYTAVIMPSSTASLEQRERWGMNKKIAKHQANVQEISYQFMLFDIDINNIKDIPDMIKMLKKLDRIRKREQTLKDQGILPKISENEWITFKNWCSVTLRHLFVGFSLEYPRGKSAEDVGDEVIELAKRYEMSSQFVQDHPGEAREHVIWLYKKLKSPLTIDEGDEGDEGKEEE